MPVRPAFTLVEMLVAMAVTLLMMAALARAFGFVGERVRDSRANLQIHSEIRDVTTRLNDELSRCTVKLQPNDGQVDQAGYFLYVEGPLTDATSSLFRATTDADGDVDLPDSRYGDFDDYLAFTAVAPPSTWFVGKVPRYILDRKTEEVLANDGIAGNERVWPADFPGDPFDPVVIKSRYAEIIYFASPEYDLSLLSTDANYDRYIDVDGDADLDGDTVANENGLPDRLKLHRRVLLIRPDLNLSATGALPQESDGTVTFMQTDVHPTNWESAMAAAHQQCDLSLRRVLGTDGLPTISVAANSLVDLALPHNRFAHVRIPNADLGVGGGSDTSMPVVSLGKPATILEMQNINGDRIAPNLAPNTNAVVTPANWCGFLRREFVLGHDGVHTSPDTTGAWSLAARVGEDVLVNNALAFDVQIYDPTANWITDTGSGLVLGPGDPGYRESINVVGAIPVARITQGGFVDLAYPALAGGSLRGWVARTRDRRSSSATDSLAIDAANYGWLISRFSGLRAVGVAANAAYLRSLYQSGRIVVDGTNQIRLFQPAFDTYTSAYERDGLLQNKRLSGGNPEGTLWTTTTAGADLGADGLDSDGLNGTDDANERETSPPFLRAADSVRITVRLENPSTRQIRQSSVVHRDGR